MARIEEAVKVYLIFDAEAGKWKVDPITYDGSPLDGTDTGAVWSPATDDEPEPTQDMLRRAWETPLPTGDELVVLLTEGWLEPPPQST